MSSLNCVHLIGRLGADPEMRIMPSGGKVANLRLATSERWRDKQTGDQQERTEWHRISVFGRIAEVCEEYLSKGDLIFIEGSIRTRKWQDKDGRDCYSTEIVAQTMTMLHTKGRNGGGTRQQQPAGAPSNATNGQRTEGADFDDDIPF